MLGVGSTFLLPKSGRGIEHLWIVLTDPDSNGLSVCVNVTTNRFGADTTVLLMPGDHPFIRHESVIHFEDARFIDLRRVQELLSRGSSGQFACRTLEHCTHILLDRIRKGLLLSKRTPNEIKERCRPLWRY